MYCIVSYSVLCMYFICYLYIIVLTNVTRKKDIYCSFLLAPLVFTTIYFFYFYNIVLNIHQNCKI